MRVRCSGEYPSEELLELLGPDFHRKQAFAISIGNEYLVLGMLFATGEPFGIGPWIQFKEDEGRFGQAPLSLFEIIDPRVSRFWEAVDWKNGVVGLGPPSFDRDFYMEDFMEGVPEIVEDFERVCRLMDSEFDDGISEKS